MLGRGEGSEAPVGAVLPLPGKGPTGLQIAGVVIADAANAPDGRPCRPGVAVSVLGQAVHERQLIFTPALQAGVLPQLLKRGGCGGNRCLSVVSGLRCACRRLGDDRLGREGYLLKGGGYAGLRHSGSGRLGR